MITPEEIEAALKLCEAATPYLKVWVECVPTKNECRIVGQTYFSYESAEIDASAINAARTLLPKALEELKTLRSKWAHFTSSRDNIETIAAEMAKLRAENERLRNEPHDVAETREALAEGEVLLENIKLRAENEKLRMDAALKTGYVEAVVGYDELRRIIRNLRAENAKLLRVKEAAEELIPSDRNFIIKELDRLVGYEVYGELKEALKALDEEGE